MNADDSWSGPGFADERLRDLHVKLPWVVAVNSNEAEEEPVQGPERLDSGDPLAIPRLETGLRRAY